MRKPQVYRDMLLKRRNNSQLINQENINPNHNTSVNIQELINQVQDNNIFSIREKSKARKRCVTNETITINENQSTNFKDTPDYFSKQRISINQSFNFDTNGHKNSLKHQILSQINKQQQISTYSSNNKEEPKQNTVLYQPQYLDILQKNKKVMLQDYDYVLCKKEDFSQLLDKIKIYEDMLFKQSQQNNKSHNNSYDDFGRINRSISYLKKKPF